MNNAILDIKKYDLENVKLQIFLFIIPVLYHYFYAGVFDYQNYFDYINLQWIYVILSYLYYVTGICCFVATVVLTVKTKKGVIRYIDYLIRAVVIGFYAIRLFIIYTLDEKLNNIPKFLTITACIISEFPKPEVLIFFTSIISFLRLIITLVKNKTGVAQHKTGEG